MDLAVFSYAAALAALAAAVFALLLGAGRLVARLARRRPPFLTTVAHEPADRYRRRWQALAAQRSLLLMPLLVFIVAASALTFAEPPVPASLAEGWRPVVLLVAILVAALALLVQALRLTIARRRIGLRIYAAKAVAQALARLTANRNRLYHDVPTGFGVVDHVVAGLHGVYAVMVVARRPGRRKSLRVEDDALQLGDAGPSVSLAHARKLGERFARECGKVLGHDLHVRLVVAVPGWDVAAQTAQDLLVANERNIAMLSGWKDERDYLMNEDVDALQRWLDERCARPG